MLETMPRPKKNQGKRVDPRKGRPAILLRLDDDAEAALQSFLKAQIVPPDKSSVAYAALMDFLQKHGHWPPKPRA